MPAPVDLSQFGDLAQQGGGAPSPPDLSQFGQPVGHPIAGPSGNFWTDAARRIGTAVVDAGTGAISPLTGLTSAYGAGPSGVTRGSTPSLPEARDNAFNALGATEYQPQTLGGRLGQAAMTGSVLGLANPASIPAMAGGSATSELAAEMFPNHPTLARMLGFLPGAVAAGGAPNLLMKPAGGAMDNQTAQLANLAMKDHGIPLAPGQLSSNPFVRYFYSETGKLPFSGAEKFGGTQQSAFNRAVAGTFGEDAERVTPEVLQAAKSRIGGMFNDVAARTTVNADPQFVNDLARVESNAPLVLTDSEWAPLRRQLDNVIGKVQPGDTISGDAYQSLTRKGTPLDLAMNSSNPNMRQWAGQIRGALDDALQRSASPDDLAQLQQARAQWKAMRTVEPLTLRADATQGAKPSTGDISPAALRSVVNQSYGNAAFASPGAVPLNDLARIGQRFLKEPPDSGTATRSLANHAAGAAGAMGTTIMAHEAGLPLITSAAGTAGGLAANRLAQEVLRNQLLARRMVGGGMKPGGFSFTYPPLAMQAPMLALPPQSLDLPAITANSGRQ